MTTIEQWVQKRSGTYGQTAQEALAALRAVAEMHAERTVVTQPGPGPMCVECRYVWPCPSIEAIHAALGIDGKDDTE